VLARRAVHRTRRDKDHLHLASVSATMCQGCAWRGLAGGHGLSPDETLVRIR
jgi:hypothetical protein